MRIRPTTIAPRRTRQTRRRRLLLVASLFALLLIPPLTPNPARSTRASVRAAR